MSKDLKLAKW